MSRRPEGSVVALAGLWLLGVWIMLALAAGPAEAQGVRTPVTGTVTQGVAATRMRAGEGERAPAQLR